MSILLSEQEIIRRQEREELLKLNIIHTQQKPLK